MVAGVSIAKPESTELIGKLFMWYHFSCLITIRSYDANYLNTFDIYTKVKNYNQAAFFKDEIYDHDEIHEGILCTNITLYIKGSQSVSLAWFVSLGLY